MLQKFARFHLYRYQLLPTDRHFQGDLYGARTINELIERKNAIFQEALKSPGAFKTSRTNTATREVLVSNDFFLFRVAANRSLRHETKDFQTEPMDNWPKILVVIWNDPDRQLIAVQHRTAAFQNTDVVVRLIFDSIEPFLSKNQLTAIWEPLFAKQLFWNLIEKHKDAIQEVEFEIITPNMANISSVLPENIKDFARATNSVRNKISIAADPTASLRIERTNPTVEALVSYSSEGGGDISLRIAGLKKRVHTSRTVKEVEIDEMTLQGNPTDVSQALKAILS